eukprot:NODE_3_length_80033_cov_0.932970.p11 type:complete len:531 gc:universal NODE_3_length_80033_cov_0.932970:70986-72578(+)
MSFQDYSIFKRLYSSEDHVVYLVKKESKFLIRKDVCSGATKIPSHPHIQNYIHKHGNKYYFDLPPSNGFNSLQRKPQMMIKVLVELFGVLYSMEQKNTKHGRVTLENIRVKNGSLYLINCALASCPKENVKSDISQFGDLLQLIFFDHCGKDTTCRPKRLKKFIKKCHMKEALFENLKREFHCVFSSQTSLKRCQSLLRRSNLAGLPPIQDEAISIAKDFRRASMGDIHSMTKIGECYATDKRQSGCSIYWLKMAAWNGCSKACLELCKIYIKGPKSLQNFIAAEALLKTHLNSYESLELYAELQIVRQDGNMDLAQMLLKRSLAKARPSAYVLMGRIYQLKNIPEKSTLFFQKAANLGNCAGRYYYSIDLVEGILMNKDLDKAKNLLHKNDEFHHPESLLLLGNVHEMEGEFASAYLSYKKGAALQDCSCAIELAKLQSAGKGCEENKSLAIKTLRSISSECPYAYFKLYLIYESVNDILNADEALKFGALKGCEECIEKMHTGNLNRLDSTPTKWRRLMSILPKVFYK